MTADSLQKQDEGAARRLFPKGAGRPWACSSQRLRAERGDLGDLGEGRAELGGGIMSQPALEGGQDLGAPASLDRHDEGKAELRLVGLVQFIEAGELRRRAFVEPGPGLLGAGSGR